MVLVRGNLNIPIKPIASGRSINKPKMSAKPSDENNVPIEIRTAIPIFTQPKMM